MKKIYLFAAMAVAVAGIVSFTAFRQHSIRLVDETISAYTGAITGRSTVEVVVDRTGPDAGQGCVTFNVDVWFNYEENRITYTYTMQDGQTHLDTQVEGPGTVGDASVYHDPYNISYGSCF